MKSEGQKHRAPEVVVIGLDGATFNLIKPWVAGGQLPTFARLLGEGAHGTLRSTIPPFSAPAWISFATGKNPGKHGIYDFVQPKGSSYQLQLTNGSLRRGKTFWRILSEEGERVGVVNVPMTFPPEEVNGFFISGFDAPDTDSVFTFPPELYCQIQAAIGEYILQPPTLKRTLAAYVESNKKALQTRYRAVKYLLERYPLDFFMVVFNESDALQHLCLGRMEGDDPRYAEALLKIYQMYDQILQDLLDTLPGRTTLIVMSDHGAGPIRKFVDLNGWLVSRGFLSYHERASKGGELPLRASFNKGANAFLQHSYSLLKDHLPLPLRHRFKRFESLRTRVESFLAFSQVNWAATRAYTCQVQGIYINLKGRQPAGIVEPSQYEDLCEEISQALYELRDPDTGEAVVAKIYRKEEIFHGPYMEAAPDLYILWKDGAYIARFQSGGHSSLFNPPRPAGWHEILPADVQRVHTATHQVEGILIMRGEKIKPGFEIEGSQIVDLAPTILWLMGQAIPEDMDGRVLSDVFTEPFTRSHTILYGATSEQGQPPRGDEDKGYSEEEAKKMKERLKGLGYL